MEGRSGSPTPGAARSEADQTFLQRAGSAAAGIGGAGPRHPAARAALQWGLAALIFGFLVAFVVRQWGKLPDYDWRFAPGWLAISVVGVLLFYVGQCELWRYILHALGEDLPGRPARAVWGKSILARYVPTNLLLIVGRVVMADRYGVARRVTLASVIYELGLQFGSAIVVGAYFVIQLPSLEDQPARWAVLVVVPAILIGLHPRVFGPLANYALRKLGRERLPKALSFGRVLEFMFGYIVCWAVVGVGVYAFAAALTTEIHASDLPYVAASYPVAFCVAVLTFIVPSGLGTRDAALATAMTAVVALSVATAVAVAFRIFQTALELLYVAVVAGLGRRSKA